MGFRCISHILYFFTLTFIYLVSFGCAGLHCCADFPLVEAGRGYSLVAVHGLLVSVAFLVEHRLQVTEFSNCSTRAQ